MRAGEHAMCGVELCAVCPSPPLYHIVSLLWCSHWSWFPGSWFHSGTHTAHTIKGLLLSHTLFLSHTYSLFLSLSHTLAPYLFLSFFLSLCFSLSLSLSLSPHSQANTFQQHTMSCFVVHAMRHFHTCMYNYFDMINGYFLAWKLVWELCSVGYRTDARGQSTPEVLREDVGTGRAMWSSARRDCIPPLSSSEGDPSKPRRRLQLAVSSIRRWC